MATFDTALSLRFNFVGTVLVKLRSDVHPALVLVGDLEVVLDYLVGILTSTLIESVEAKMFQLSLQTNM